MHTVSRMKNQGIGLPSDDGFVLPGNLLRFSPASNRTAAKIAAGVLITAGSVSLISNVLNNLRNNPWIDQDILHIINSTVRNSLIPGAVSVILIIAGIKLLLGSKIKNGGGDLP
jgi:hypothetical protein